MDLAAEAAVVQESPTVADAMEAYMRVLNRPRDQVSSPPVIEHDAAEN